MTASHHRSSGANRARWVGPILFALVTFLAPRPEAQAGAFTPGNLAVVSVSTGGGTSAASVRLLEYTTGANQSNPVQTIALNSGLTGTRLTQSGSDPLEGSLSLSSDGRYLTLVGYNAAAGTAAVASTSTGAVQRVIGRVGLDGIANLSTTTTSYSGTSIRSATSSDGSRFWTAGDNGANQGLRTTTFGASGAAADVNPNADVRVVQVINGQLYGSTANNIFRTNPALPQGAGGTTTPNLPGVFAFNAAGFVLLDRNAGVTGVDTLYVASQAGGLVKYSFDGATWTYRDFVSVSGGVTGITGAVNGSNADLYVTTGDGTTAGNQLRRFTDTTTFNSDIAGSFTTLATAVGNTAFRGVAFTPVPEPASLLLGGLACAGLAAAIGRYRKPLLVKS